VVHPFLIGICCVAVAMILSTPVEASIAGILEAEIPLVEMFLVGGAAGISLAALWFRQQLGDLWNGLGLDQSARADAVSARADAARRFREERLRHEWHGNRVSAVPLPLRQCNPKEWDAFAQHCNASYRSAQPWLRAWSLKWRFRYDLRLFELHAGGRRIGQCAVGIGSNHRIFLDRLMLKPGFEALWADAMSDLLAQLGPGTYRYGWQLNLEQRREEDLKKVPGVTVQSVKPLTVHAVDFRQWASWDEYWKSTSSNAKRNAKRAQSEGVRIDVRRGCASLRHVVPLVRLRALMYERKGIEFRSLKVLASYIATFMASPKYTITAIAADAERSLAGFSGTEFGTHTYYLDGGSRPANKGAAWYLQKTMLQRAWKRHPGRATFVMGYVDYATHDEAVGGGLLRSRKAVRASDYETSVVKFTYRPSTSEDGRSNPAAAVGKLSRTVEL
jgi:hypothetical protein